MGMSSCFVRETCFGKHRAKTSKLKKEKIKQRQVRYRNIYNKLNETFILTRFFFLHWIFPSVLELKKSRGLDQTLGEGGAFSKRPTNTPSFNGYWCNSDKEHFECQCFRK